MPDGPTSTPDRPASAADGLRFAFGTLSVLRVPVRRWDRPTAGRAMLCAPLVGLVLGLVAAAAGAALSWLGGGALLASVAVVGVLAALTRGLHLDGLADVADGLGSNKPPEAALRIMKASDIGPFGVLVLLLVMLAQIAALERAFEAGTAQGACGAVLAAAVGRAALLLGCRTGVPSARPDGLGATVAGTVRTGSALVAAVLTAAALAAAGWATGGHGGHGARLALAALLALVCGPVCSSLLLARCVRRFGGITGDVLGAMVETSATAAVVLWALFAAS
ncbi:adenosylcobinamide-GDP ribazoletransferase [Streptacidiphilus albus]|uniref:adenosylcobinamide-GDP ribazoletransferase n=1 Tax=Streptacidiphilus albus TaxID=105425 RepID=UPI0005A8FD8D|nr:adenosylcobinamide-GDP ribazoletransferase [Streptacidiphilus albus]